MRIVKVSEFYASIGQSTDCFYSFFYLDQTLFSVHRRHRLFSYHNWPRSQSENLSQIVLTGYANKDPGKIESEEVLCDGNDPRVVSNGSEAFVLSEGAVHSGVDFTLTRLPSREQTRLKRGPGVPPGKNWQPFLRDGRLCVVDSIAPFRTKQINITSGEVTRSQEWPLDLDLPAAHDDYPILRGGSNAILHEDTLYGWGHATVRPYMHQPYIWKLSDAGPTVSFLNLHGMFRDRGYSIVDPTSFFEWDADHFALGLSCSQRDWFHPQWFLNVLVLIEKHVFFRTTPFALNCDTLRSSIIFHADDLDSLIDSVSQNGGISNNGHKGCLVCGPSRTIDLSKRWAIELCYSSMAATSKRVGDFDVLLNIDGVDRIVASTHIFGTVGESQRVRLTFDLRHAAGSALIQTRVFTRRRSAVTAYFFELIHENQ